jgi:cysteine desulfurase
VGALPAEVTFTSGGTEANNLALSGSGRRRMLVSAIEHDSVLRAATNTELVAVGGNGVVDLAALEKMLRSSREPALVSVMFANNETGVLQPIADVVRLASKAGALVHCDAVQGAGKLPIDLHALGVDYLSLSAHKLGGPTGVGALVVRNGAPLIAGQLGGGQELNRRAGTENVAGIAGFGAAAAAAGSGLDVAGLRDRMERALLAAAPQARVFGAEAPRLPNTTCISMPGVKAETQVMALDLAGVCVSAGAACSSGKVTRSSVLLAMGVDATMADSALRISLGWDSGAGDIERLIEAWRDLYIRVNSSDMVRARAA